MNFANWILLGGVAAFSIPLVIHLLNRSRYRTVEWGAMHLLDSAVQSNSKRLRMEQLILLLIRCAIPVLLALCLARPVLTGWQTLPGETPKSVVVLLDNSYSMEAKSTAGTVFTNATEMTCQIIESLKRGSEISVVNTGGGPAPVFDTPVFDARMVTNQLRRRQSGFGSCDTPASLEAALAIMSEATHLQREIVLVSDFQDANWRSLDDNFVQRVRNDLEQMDVPPDLTFVRVNPSSQGENVSLQSLDYSRTAIGVGQTLKLRAHLKNHDSKSYKSLRLELLVDGQQQAVSQVPLAAGATSQVLFTYQFDRAGSHTVEVVLHLDDALQHDNRIAASISVLDRIDVTLVDGARSNLPLESETDFLAIALTPFSEGSSKLSDLIELRTVQPGQLDDQLLNNSDVVVLANVERLSDVELARLSSYVSNGGSLLLFPGNKTDVDWHNEAMASAGLLPLEFGPLQGSKSNAEQQTRIREQRFDHPALQFFNDRTNGNLADGEIWIWYRLTGLEDNARSTFPIVRFGNGDPFLVEKSVGDGLVIQAATACDADWSNLPTRPYFVPLAQELVVKLASRVAPPRNIQAGDPLVAIFSADVAGTAMTLTAPNGKQVTVQAVQRDDRSVVEFSETQLPGIYRLEGGGDRQFFVSSSSRYESDLETIGEDRLTEIADSWGADIVTSAAEREGREQVRQNGHEIWRIFLLAVFCLMLGEIFLQQRFAGRS